MTENQIAEIVFKCAMRVHKTLGPGLLESAYEACLFYELDQYDLKVERQKTLPLVYDGVQLDIGYRLDLVINDCVIIELKTVDSLNDLHTAQLLTYLKLKKSKLGLLINFNTTLLKHGFKRVINGHLEGPVVEKPWWDLNNLD